MTDTPIASVIVPCWGERQHLLLRSLLCLYGQTVPVQVVIVNDGADLEPPEGAWLRRDTPDRLVSLRPFGERNRRPNYALVAGYHEAVADYIVLSEPELLVPKDAIEQMIAGHERPHRDVPILYCLDQRMTYHLDALPWQADLDRLTTLPGFWNYVGIFNRTNREAAAWKHHWGFCGAYRNEWALTDFLPEGETVELDPDNWLREREVLQGRLPRQTHVTVYHQWHERIDPGNLAIPPMSVQQRRIRDANAREPY